ncbi:MAG: Thiol-disulfide oxidoreductase ResA [Candidatus Heimdallarchaeota archaeon LC_2]|nr:MAG: Thiol-disulfide oxidoreductase ResA [Candidatus Heimdallarchaeota archaeon LC_2]
MKKNYIYVIGVILILIIQVTGQSGPYNFNYIRSDGVESQLIQDESIYIFVEFFATWCDSCRLEMATLSELHPLLPNNILMKQISISPDTDSLEKIIEFQQEYKADWEFGVDSRKYLTEMFSISVLPTSALFSPEGYLLKMWVGLTKLSKFINDLNYEVPNANIPPTEGSNHKISFAINSLISNPLFIITALVILISPITIHIFSKVKKKNLAIIHQ